MSDNGMSNFVKYILLVVRVQGIAEIEASEITPSQYAL